MTFDADRLRDAVSHIGVVVVAGGLLDGVIADGRWHEAVGSVVVGAMLVVSSIIRRSP